MYRTQNYMVIYIDLLGVKNAIKQDYNDDFLNDIHMLYKNVSVIVNQMMPITGIEDCKFKIFSDNIIIAIPSNITQRDDHHPVIALNRAQTAAMFLQREFLKKDILIRGGVTYGKLYIDDVFVWGKALISAYELEDKIAIFPRIIVDKCILQKEFLNILDDDFYHNLLSSYQVREDFDGEYYFDYLNFPKDKDVYMLVNNSLECVL